MALPNLSFLFRSRDGDDSPDSRHGSRRNPARPRARGTLDSQSPAADTSPTDADLAERQFLTDTERQLVISVRLGDVTAFDTLVDMYYIPLVRSLLRYTRQRESAEDIAQDTFAQLWHGRGELDPNRSIRAYIFKSGRNRALKVLAHEKVVHTHATHALAELGEAAEESPMPGPDIEVEMADLGRLAERRIALLSPRLREVYRLSRESFLTPAEIAVILGTSVKTVHGQLAKVLEVLAPALRRWLDE